MTIEERSFSLPWSRKSYEEIIALDTVKVWVVKKNGNLVGYALVQRVLEELELHTFAVDPECRRQGVGERLLRHMIYYALGQSIKNIFLMVRVSNLPARTLYTKLGFLPVGVRRGYYTDNGEDAIVMRLNLDNMGAR